ncbi:hypothetical protein LRAMOSA08482 [Lichtheimia ramosa]|uniref:Peroxin/Ferlin domain-containing protein n=1 Tax=Lichtheimia ramosa TaxID=688394 RepID=A0A077WFN4_9FUNG|nr:hypothetical protein LRAMOSA08482 [Lichtheimia ramosa]
MSHVSKPTLASNAVLSPSHRATTSEHIQSVIVTAALHATDSPDPPNEYLANLPPLNAQISAKNFVRFASRCGFMFAFRDAVLLLLSWDKPLDTMVAMVGYILVCMYPRLLLLAPHAILLHLLLSSYQKQQDLLKIRREGSPEYLRNMQNLQNMMGEISNLYDTASAYQRYIDWSDEKLTMSILQATLASAVALGIIVWWIPLRLCALIGGCSLFLANTRFAKYCWRELGPDAMMYAQEMFHGASNWYNDRQQPVKHAQEQGTGQNNDEQVQVSLYENQRWWPGTGFAPQMLEGERSPWSDLSGSVQLQPKEDMTAPKGYRWSQDNWQLDTTGPWIDDVLGIEFLVSPEEGGWVYTNNHWEYEGKSNGKDRQGRLTRRRRWIRNCIRTTNDML